MASCEHDYGPEGGIISHMDDEEMRDHVEMLLDKLIHPETPRRRKAAEALACYICDQRYLPADFDPHPAETLAKFLSKPRVNKTDAIGSVKALAIMNTYAAEYAAKAVGLMTVHSDGELRWEAVRALRCMGPGAADGGATALATALINDQTPSLRYECARSLEAMGPAAAKYSAPSLAKAIIEDDDVDVQRASIIALGAMGPAAAPGGARTLVQLLGGVRPGPAVLDLNKIAEAGHVLREKGIDCIASFPGRHGDAWRDVIKQGDLKISVASVFLPDAEHGLGKHQRDEDNPQNPCYCKAIYGDRDYRELGYLMVTNSRAGLADQERLKKFASATDPVLMKGGAAEVDRKAAETAAEKRCTQKHNVACWGCAWFSVWKKRVHEAVETYGQKLSVYYFEDQVGQGKVEWGDLAKTSHDLWDGVGLGGSQKVEVAYLDLMRAQFGHAWDYEEKDAKVFLKESLKGKARSRVLAPHFQGHSFEFRHLAVESLAKMGEAAAKFTGGAAPAMLGRMLHPTPGSDEKLRRAAAEALGKMGFDAVKQEEVMLARTLALDTHSAPLGDLSEGRDILDQTKPLLPQVKELFDQIVGESGSITLEDIQYALEDEESDEIKSYFIYLLMDVSDANNIFKLLDIDRDSAVDLNEFISGIERLQVRRSAAESLHLAGCKRALKGSMELRDPDPPPKAKEKKKGLKQKVKKKDKKAAIPEEDTVCIDAEQIAPAETVV